MRKIFLVAALAIAASACGEMPNQRAAFQADCKSLNGTYQDEGGPDWSPSDAECMFPTASGQIAEKDYSED